MVLTDKAPFCRPISCRMRMWRRNGPCSPAKLVQDAVSSCRTKSVSRA